MEIKTYKKDAEYTYTLGAFPTIELLKTRPREVLEVYVHSTFTDVKTIEELAKKMAVVLTGAASIANMSVRELVSLGRAPYTGFLGVLNAEDEQAVERAMEIMGVAELAERDIYTLSDGERQKCMIAKALAQQTPVIILDEPTAYLDYPSKVRLMQMLKKVAATEGKAVIVSTHDLDITLRIADKIWLMNSGRLAAGTVAELSQNGDFGSFINDDGVFYNEKENTNESCNFND